MTTVKNRLSTVITTIQRPTVSVCKLVRRLVAVKGNLIVVGDKKGPVDYDLEGAQFLSLADQLDSDFELARKLPTAHYARKNVGYLEAISQGASCIYETDDDNAPLDTWEPRAETVRATRIEECGWMNVYRVFCDDQIWPRGFPIDEVAASFSGVRTRAEESLDIQAPIQQGLVNNSPDVDAIWRLTLDRPFDFQLSPSVYLPRGAWCPFNSQSTWWFPVAYPLMYLPSHCSFRMTDIWRSFVAQRCLWEIDLGIVFHGPEVVQQRNEHDLMRDFEDEIPGYLGNKKLVAILEGLALSKGADAVGANLFTCYEELVRSGVLAEKEVELVKIWLTDLEKARSN
jgi:STELLO glycosyltransferases